MKNLILLIGLLTAGSAHALFDCDYHFQLSSAVIEVLDNSQAVQQNISINRGASSPNGKCTRYRVYFSKGLANNYQRRAFTTFGKSLNYNLHRTINQSGILKDFGDAVTANEYLEGTANEKFTTYANRFFVSIPGMSSSNVSSGVYFDLVQVAIYGYHESFGTYILEETGTFTVLTYVPKKLQVSLLDEGEAFDSSSTSKVLDFGILSQNQERGADLRIVSNGSYQIKISSQNNGSLKLSQGESISYSLRVNNSNVSLAGSLGSPVLIGSGDETSTAGDRYNLKIKITESTDNKSAGLYQDVLTIMAIAN